MEIIMVAALLGLIPAAIASKKGRSFVLWWFFGTALFIIALPIALIMSAQGQQPQEVEGALRKCPKCAEFIQPDASICKHCRAEVSPLTSNERKALAKKTKEANNLSAGQIVAALLLSAAVIWWFVGGGLESQTASSMAKIEDQVAVDAVSQYNIAKRQGDAMQICVQAGFVSAAYLQAKDEANYQSAKRTEAQDCKSAGVPQ